MKPSSTFLLLLILASSQHATEAQTNLRSQVDSQTQQQKLNAGTSQLQQQQQRQLKNKNKNKYYNNKKYNNQQDGYEDENAKDEAYNEEEGEDGYYDNDGHYISSSMNAYNQSDASKNVAVVFTVLLAVFAGVAIGIVAAAGGKWESARCKFLALRQHQQEQKAAARAKSLKQNILTGADDCSIGTSKTKDSIVGSVIGNDTIVTSFSEQETGQEGIGTPAIVQMTSLKTTRSADFGGGYVAPQEHTRVNILYNA